MILAKEPACRVAGKGGWAVAQSPILVTTITLERLRKRGYESMLGVYEKITTVIATKEAISIRIPRTGSLP